MMRITAVRRPVPAEHVAALQAAREQLARATSAKTYEAAQAAYTAAQQQIAAHEAAVGTVTLHVPPDVASGAPGAPSLDAWLTQQLEQLYTSDGDTSAAVHEDPKPTLTRGRKES